MSALWRPVCSGDVIAPELTVGLQQVTVMLRLVCSGTVLVLLCCLSCFKVTDVCVCVCHAHIFFMSER